MAGDGFIGALWDQTRLVGELVSLFEAPWMAFRQREQTLDLAARRAVAQHGLKFAPRLQLNLNPHCNCMVPLLRVDPVDGSIKLPELAHVIRRGMSQTSAETMLAEFLRAGVDHGNGYSRSNIHGLALAGIPCGLALGFHRDALMEVHLGVMLPDVKLEGGWPTRQAINDEIAFVRSVFHDQLGRDFGDEAERFSWGVAWSGFDAKGFMATAGVRYD